MYIEKVSKKNKLRVAVFSEAQHIMYIICCGSQKPQHIACFFFIKNLPIHNVQYIISLFATIVPSKPTKLFFFFFFQTHKNNILVRKFCLISSSSSFITGVFLLSFFFFFFICFNDPGKNQGISVSWCFQFLFFIFCFFFEKWL